MNRRTLIFMALVGLLGTAWWQTSRAADGPQVDKAALERTRKQIRMLDDIYKNAVVLITDKYVNKPDDFAAGSAAVALFAAVKKAGWHDVRLLDASGMPVDNDNVAKDEFEKEAVKQLKSGKASFERIETRKDGPYLRTATIVPVVLKKCTMCHENYKQVKDGEAIGALSYTLKIE